MTALWTPRTLMGFLAFLIGVAFAVWMLHDHTLTWQSLVVCGALAGAGMWFVDPPAMQSYVAEVQQVVPLVAPHLTAERGGRRASDPVVVTADTTPPPPHIDPDPTQRIVLPVSAPAPARMSAIAPDD